MIESFVTQIPTSLLERSGKVFYSGRLAFSKASPLYVLGANPGGDPAEMTDETIGTHTDAVIRRHPEDWSAYRDERWRGVSPATVGMAPRLLHIFARLGLNPGMVLSSNLVFASPAEKLTFQVRCGSWPICAGPFMKGFLSNCDRQQSYVWGRLRASTFATASMHTRYWRSLWRTIIGGGAANYWALSRASKS
jgi:hypothetical protein